MAISRTCDVCGKFDDSSLDRCCEIGPDDVQICGVCSANVKTRDCAKCGQTFCGDHGCTTAELCCGKHFCGDCKDHHKMKVRECGHGHTSCHYSMNKPCVICERVEDIELAKDLKRNCKSNSLKECLSTWLKESETMIKEAEKTNNQGEENKRRRLNE